MACAPAFSLSWSAWLSPALPPPPAPSLRPPDAPRTSGLPLFMAPVARMTAVSSGAGHPGTPPGGAGLGDRLSDLTRASWILHDQAPSRALPGRGKRHVDVESAQGRLTEAVNAALGGGFVVGVDLVPGLPRRTAADPRLTKPLSARSQKVGTRSAKNRPDRTAPLARAFESLYPAHHDRKRPPVGSIAPCLPACLRNGRAAVPRAAAWHWIYHRRGPPTFAAMTTLAKDFPAAPG
jgi:hypothetical protein